MSALRQATLSEGDVQPLPTHNGVHARTQTVLQPLNGADARRHGRTWVNGQAGGGLGRINRRNSLGRQLAAEQGTVRRGATLTPECRRVGGTVVFESSSLTDAEVVCRFGNSTDVGRGGLVTMVKHGAFH